MAVLNVRRYEHSPLQHRSSIRLLTLLPGSPSTPLRCQITEFQKFSNPSYEALSYAWGDPVFPEVIQVCESADIERISWHIPITQNLSEALRRLRSDAPRTLWIDALCINQEDLEEKGHQVARMGRVYHEANRVIVWLGEDQAYPRTRALLTQDGRNRWPLTLPESDLGELATIPWFSRVWAVQEYVLARQVFFQLGPLLTSAQKLETVVKRTGVYIDGDKKLYDQWKSILRLFEYRKLVQERESDDANSQLTLVRIFLDLTRSRLCKDSRDRIYGILGIFEDVNIVPYYTLPPRQVYQDFVSKNLVAGDFSILHECCIGTAQPEEQSYVPFFGQSRSQSTYTSFASRLATYCAGLHQPPVVNIDEDNYISVQGFFIDTVQQKLDFAEDCDIELESGGPLTHNPGSGSETAKLPLHGTWGAIYQTALGHLVNEPEDQSRWRKDFEVNRLFPQFSMAPYPHNSLFDVLVRAIRTDLNGDYDWTSSNGRIRTDSHLHRSRRENLQERSLFWTTAGFIGLGTCYLQPGDEVVVFNGDTTPFLLRKEGYLEGTETDVYKIVSDCYVYGWMYGPFPDRTVARDPSRRLRITNRVKGLLTPSVDTSGKQQSSLPTRTFIIS
ncbi:HET-domain-containing protein [Macroventuria anomochaeta]|uniref:HET-domain-containing protein n=1 Tax=Macroventuria anomochaeta TaxID=301207 RepID=A0ACB6RPR9_9PLEO|nr:HET-domain-containing protein [Macroventuria anomochaeta]KAF2623123.1 HET-domain-containing protein [Macroventuria anomochaeta]